MAGTKDLKNRISTVKNTQQTTRAMKMVSAAKLRRSQDAIVAQRPYARGIANTIQRVVRLPGATSATRYLASVPQEGQRRVALLVLVTSDRGLCGGFNSAIIKKGLRWLQENKSKYDGVDLAFVGRKAHDFYRFNKHPISYFAEFGPKATFAQAKKLNDWVMEKYLAGEVSEVFFIYNEFKNAISQTVVVEPFLPIPELPQAEGGSDEASPDLFLVKPSVPSLLDSLLQKHFSVQVLRVLLESQASEHGARMSSMDSATRNAGEMIRKLTLRFNKQRQSGITQELLEIISGAESQKQ